MAKLEKYVNALGYAVAFSLFPTSMDDLMKVADAGMVMPPKSTWFEPKLRSGLLSTVLLNFNPRLRAGGICQVNIMFLHKNTNTTFLPARIFQSAVATYAHIISRFL
jgi:hypothetical protein